jgi:hypothetical protein
VSRWAPPASSRWRSAFDAAVKVTRLLLERGEQGGIQAIPPTLQQSLTARLDRLGPAREVAQIASVIGRGFSYPLLRAVAGTEDGSRWLWSSRPVTSSARSGRWATALSASEGVCRASPNDAKALAATEPALADQCYWYAPNVSLG